MNRWRPCGLAGGVLRGRGKTTGFAKPLRRAFGKEGGRRGGATLNAISINWARRQLPQARWEVPEVVVIGIRFNRRVKKEGGKAAGREK